MTRFPRLTKRILLIAAHDALVTAVAVVAELLPAVWRRQSCRGRLPQLLVILPYFVAFSVVVCYVCNLTLTKWRFTSLPELVNIVKVSTILSVALLVLDYIFVAPNVLGAFFFGKTTIVIYWLFEIGLLSGIAACLSLLSYLAHAHARAGGESRRRCCSSATPPMPNC